MFYKCKKCNCLFEVNIIEDGKEEIKFAVCANCGTGDLIEIYKPNTD